MEDSSSLDITSGDSDLEQLGEWRLSASRRCTITSSRSFIVITSKTHFFKVVEGSGTTWPRGRRKSERFTSCTCYVVFLLHTHIYFVSVLVPRFLQESFFVLEAFIHDLGDQTSAETYCALGDIILPKVAQ